LVPGKWVLVQHIRVGIVRVVDHMSGGKPMVPHLASGQALVRHTQKLVPRHQLQKTVLKCSSNKSLMRPWPCF
jgi:hypothetical protein